MLNALIKIVKLVLASCVPLDWDFLDWDFEEINEKIIYPATLPILHLSVLSVCWLNAILPIPWLAYNRVRIASVGPKLK